MNIKLSEQLVMTPQLQLALRLLETPTDKLDAIIARMREGLVDGDPDPSDDDTWTYLDDPPFSPPIGDVFVFGNPPQARANGCAFPRYRGTTEESRWLVRALRQRAKSYEKVVGAIVGLRPQISIAMAGEKSEPVTARALAKQIDIHESTIGRVIRACRWQNVHGTFGFAMSKRGISIA